MRVKIQGIVNQERFKRTLEKVAEYLDSSGIQQIQGINFYLTPLHPETGEEALIIDSLTREEIDTIMLDNPTQKVTKRKSSQIKAVDTIKAEAIQKQKKGRKKTQ
ncbi:hypothetical protein [Chroococcus sp. FPU101]|uniref:hypothetical protein n=1 Tax=Chroococcus sp. FPU101 TaxID=1974212 RepID=UPI001A8FF77D|nr:hypothetical protein [Chroococcus sp. FPU101]GFE72317.1 hypothetical protein CFPU101_49270 [Chroococcus sp. FPU101]